VGERHSSRSGIGFPFLDHCLALTQKAVIDESDAHSYDSAVAKVPSLPFVLRSVTRLAEPSLSVHLCPNRLEQGQSYRRSSPPRGVAILLQPINRSTAKHVHKKQVSPFSIRLALDPQLPFNSYSPKSEINWGITDGMVTGPLPPSIPPRSGMQEASTNSASNPHREQSRGWSHQLPD